MRPRVPVSWWLAAIAGLTLIAAAAAGLFDRRPPPANTRPILRVMTPEIAGHTRISQQFTMYFPALTSIDVFPVAMGAPTGDVQFELWTLSGDTGTLIRRSRVGAAEMARNERYSFRFSPFAESRSRRFRVDISPAEDSPAGGIALWATRGLRIPESFIAIDGQSRAANLMFETHVVGPPPRPRGQVRAAFAALAAAWLAALYMLRQLAS